MFDKLKKASKAAVVGSVLVAGTVMAQTGPDVSSATTALSEAATAIGLIGAAMVTAAAAGIVYRWVTAFLVK